MDSSRLKSGSGVKRPPDRTPNPQPIKKSKSTIMDYMMKHPRSRSRPTKAPSGRADDSEADTLNANELDDASQHEIEFSKRTRSDPLDKTSLSPDCTSKAKSKNASSSGVDTGQHSTEYSVPNSRLSLAESTGDIFDAPEGTLIIHACNCQGSWGAGIAAAFKSHYPYAYKQYASRCQKWKHRLFESAQLIPPQPSDGQGHFVGCLYTSRFYGKRKDTPSKILSVTAPAMRDLLEKVKEWNQTHEEGEKINEVRMCMINSGLFAVPWEETRAALEGIDVRNLDVKEIKVISRDE